MLGDPQSVLRGREGPWECPGYCTVSSPEDL